MRLVPKAQLSLRQTKLKLWLKARKFKARLDQKQWCDYWHTHFDWDGEGNTSKIRRRLYLRAMLRAMGRVYRELQALDRPAQVFLVLEVADSASDGLYLHTPNPHHTPFPHCPSGMELLYVPPLLTGLVGRQHHVIHHRSSENGVYLTVQLKRQVLKYAAFPASA